MFHQIIAGNASRLMEEEDQSLRDHHAMTTSDEDETLSTAGEGKKRARDFDSAGDIVKEPSTKRFKPDEGDSSSSSQDQGSI